MAKPVVRGKGSPARAGFYRGSEGRQRSEDELAKQKAAAEMRKESYNQPYRFWIGEGQTTQFVVLDDAPDFYRYEHNLKNPSTQKWDTFTGCVAEWDNCPVCEAAGQEPYYAMYLSVLDFTPFTTKDGVEHEFSRKLMVVKPAQHKKFLRAFARMEKDGLSMRGALFEATRDGPKDPRIGNEIEYVEHLSEDDLAGYVRSWKDREGKKHTENCSEVFDYEALFEEPDTDKLRALVGGTPTPGSRAHERRELGRPTRGKASHEDEGDEDDDWEEEAKPARMSRGKSAAPAKAPVRGRGREEESDEEEDEEEERPARRAPARPSAKAAPANPAVRGRKAAEPEDDEEPPFDADEDDDPPAKAPGRRMPVRGARR